MLTRRIIPCLDVRDGRVVKGIQFQGLRDAGEPVERAALYEQQGADELVILDVSATPEGRSTAVETVAKVRDVLSIPLTVGGGVKEIDDALRLLDAGADKVGMNSAAVKDPTLIERTAARVGAQCVVLAVDAARVDGSPEKWEIVTMSGTNRTGIDVLDWVTRAEQLGAGEILLTSWDEDGRGKGYDLPLLNAVSSTVKLPIIASGGASTPKHMSDAIDAGADAVLAATIFHDGHTTVRDVKQELRTLGVEVRL